jgi:hypothetical protein
VESAGVDGAATPPKAASGSAKSSATPAHSAKSPDASDTESGESKTPAEATDSSQSEPDSQSQTPAGGKTADGEKAHRYDLKSLKRWAEQNPEQAQEAARAVFGVEPKEGFIKLQNKRRRVREELRETHEKNLQLVRSEAMQAKADREKAEEVVGQIRWVTDMWAAGSRKNEKGEPQPDFDAMDEAFRQNTGGMSIDDYMRLRARRGVASPELARERAQRLRAEQELQRLKGGQSNGAAASTPPEGAAPANGAGVANVQTPAPAAPTTAPAPGASSNPEETWGEDVPADHQLRQFAGWANDLDKEMQRHYDRDLDEYDVDPEEVADQLLQRRLSALTGQQAAPAAAPPPAAKTRPNTPKRRAQSAPAVGADGIPSAAALTPKGSVPTKATRAGHKEGIDPKSEDFEGTWSQRQSRALERHYARMRGEHVD